MKRWVNLITSELRVQDHHGFPPGAGQIKPSAKTVGEKGVPVILLRPVPSVFENAQNPPTIVALRQNDLCCLD
jgi:hypothetical protein